MRRYIDADKLLNKLPDDLPFKASVKRVLMQAPAADVVEVRHGEWVSYVVGEAGSFDIYAHYCNECDFVYESGSEYGCKYCPNCGAKMDGGVK